MAQIIISMVMLGASTRSQACGASENNCSSCSSSFLQEEKKGNMFLQIDRKLKNAKPKKLLYVGVLSAPKNKARRDFVRISYMNALRQKYGDSRILAEFVIGHTPFTGNEQGTQGTPQQLQVERDLDDELGTYNDIRRMVLPDRYENLPDKVFHLLRHSEEQQYDFLMKLDDDMMLNADAIESFLSSQNANDLLYAGTYLWSSQVYESQQGADKKFAPYFAGPCYLLSRSLVHQIVADHGEHTAAFIRYGSSSEDVVMGRWVDWESQLGYNVTLKHLPGEVVTLPKE